jgi:hypothetical protein
LWRQAIRPGLQIRRDREEFVVRESVRNGLHDGGVWTLVSALENGQLFDQVVHMLAREVACPVRDLKDQRPGAGRLGDGLNDVRELPG